MSTSIHRTPKSGRQSLFFQDLGTPVSSRRVGRGQVAAVSALRRENGANSDLTPPPIFTLEDRFGLSPEPGIPEYSMSSEVKPYPRSPVQEFSRDLLTPKSDINPSYSGISKQRQQQSPVGSSSWWSPVIGGGSAEKDETGKGSPVEGMVQSGSLITLPPPREVARPDMKKSLVPKGNLDEEEWVTVYGFLPADTNFVLREFENCGLILKYVPGPREANWMHILYQNQSDAQRALSKNGTCINGILIIGVKHVDPLQRQALNHRLNNQGFMALPPAPPSNNFEPNGFKISPLFHNGSSASRQPAGTMATPAKSTMSKFMDLMFGV